MNRLAGLFFATFLISTFCSANTKNGDVCTESTEDDSITILAKSLLSVLETYKNEQRDQCIFELTQNLGFELVKDVTHEVPKNCTVDSLVVGNDQLSRWAYFKTVDLEYLKDVEAVITLKTTESKELAKSLADILMREGFDLSQPTATLYEFKDQQGGHVIDSRFCVPTRSHIRTRYHYQIEVLDDYLIFDVREVLSDNWVTDAMEDMEQSRLAKN
ncbi:MAG: hypothetical protein RLN88_11225 [Ekhidna sp.]|uniref:hypothetical protein n=1 Tax=Ekhidna sp. TaxID=2608089 RepID=UPI0032EF78E8